MAQPNPSLFDSSVNLPRAALREMLNLAHLLYQLSKDPAYFALLQDTLPAIAHFDPLNDGVLMGYDFHLSPTGPKLIEVNSNAGGLWLAWLAHHPESNHFSGRLHDELLAMFINEYALWCGNKQARPSNIAIIDEQPKQQFLYTEMQAFAQLLNAANIRTFILEPADLTLTASGLMYHNTPIDFIYNRHCDFYLQTEALTAIRCAWLNKQLCLTPNPYTYALLADKQRLCAWSTPAILERLNLTPAELHLIGRTIPKTRLLNTQNPDQIWQQRKQLVFKPANAYASKGVYLGKKLTTTKFTELNATTNTLIQEYIAPSTISVTNGTLFKVDFRLFTYQTHILSVAARRYQGQVTNLRAEGGGFMPVRIV